MAHRLKRPDAPAELLPGRYVAAGQVEHGLGDPDALRRDQQRRNRERDAYGQTWHLPVDPERLTYAEIIGAASQITGRDIRYTTVPSALFKLGGLFNQSVREASELLPRYRDDNIFDSSKFDARFPDFDVTAYRDGITEILTA